MKKPSAILMGSKPGSVVALSVMLERGWEVRCVVTSRRNLHAWIGGPTLHEFAAANGIRTFSQSEIPRGEMADFVISYMFRYRVRPDILSLAHRAAVNFHAGPLPEFGGWAFYSVAILENAPEYGCSCHYMDNGFDTGPLLKVRRFPIVASSETAYSLEQKAQAEMVRLFADFCEMAESGDSLPCEVQDKHKFRYLSQEEFESLKRIPKDADPETIERHARAFWYPPYDCAMITAGDNEVEVVPKIVKEELATLLHADDLKALQRAALEYHPEAVR
jgi:methionyl-tRNA formyltransferase